MLYTVVILWGVPRLGRLFFRHFSGNVVEFQFVLVVLFVAAVAAQLIGIHTIVGAFLAGLAINETLSEQSRAIKNVLFLGDSFFVPLFLVTVGMRLDPAAVVANERTLLIGLSLTVAVYVTKFLASWITARLYGYSRDQMMTSWGLSQAQAAATLATILVGTEAGVFPEYIFNAAILMILFTSVSSPLLVQHFGENSASPGRGRTSPGIQPDPGPNRGERPTGAGAESGEYAGPLPRREAAGAQPGVGRQAIKDPPGKVES